jgi:hypothetical protein
MTTPKDVLKLAKENKAMMEVDALRLRPHPYEFFLYYDL